VRYLEAEDNSGILVVLESTRRIAQHMIQPGSQQSSNGKAAEHDPMAISREGKCFGSEPQDTMKRLSLAGGGIRVSSITGSLVLVKVAVSDTATQRCSSNRRLRQLWCAYPSWLEKRSAHQVSSRSNYL
jgi:hypothetical protein